MKLNSRDHSLIRQSLAEDRESGDVTSRLLIPASRRASAFIAAKEPGIFCGGPVAEAVFKSAGRGIRVRCLVKEGSRVRRGEKVMRITGPARGILEAERTALNFLGHLSGIATKTLGFVRRLKKFKIQVLDTRKTTPLLRKFEKYAVKTGGGTNHRMGLYDAVFVKENHRVYGDLKRLRTLRGKFEIEVRDLRELTEALMLKPAVILFDNFHPSDLRVAVRLARRCAPGILLEASGGITEKNIARFAAAGVDRISAGALTHSVRSLDFSLLMES